MKEEGAQTRYSDKLEIMVLELKKLPPEARSEAGVVRWMRFLSGKGKEDLAEMAEERSLLKRSVRGTGAPEHGRGKAVRLRGPGKRRCGTTFP